MHAYVHMSNFIYESSPALYNYNIVYVIIIYIYMYIYMYMYIDEEN